MIILTITITTTTTMLHDHQWSLQYHHHHHQHHHYPIFTNYHHNHHHCDHASLSSVIIIIIIISIALISQVLWLMNLVHISSLSICLVGLWSCLLHCLFCFFAPVSRRRRKSTSIKEKKFYLKKWMKIEILHFMSLQYKGIHIVWKFMGVQYMHRQCGNVPAVKLNLTSNLTC